MEHKTVEYQRLLGIYLDTYAALTNQLDKGIYRAWNTA